MDGALILTLYCVVIVEKDGMWLASHIRELLDERDAQTNDTTKTTKINGTAQLNGNANPNGNGHLNTSSSTQNGVENTINTNGFKNKPNNGITSRELSGEMGGDTTRGSA